LDFHFCLHVALQFSLMAVVSIVQVLWWHIINLSGTNHQFSCLMTEVNSDLSVYAFNHFKCLSIDEVQVLFILSNCFKTLVIRDQGVRFGLLFLHLITSLN